MLWLDELPLATVGLVTLLVMRALGQASALGATAHQLRERLTHLDRVEEHLAAGRPAAPQGGGPAPTSARSGSPGSR
ncbi:hypothetical protein [Pseudofrankia sp. DC12]|uniref:hypothetical protein n=1 Tax=Pseudofrankia sp. DC12 TaxID=683315 RepID=UPI0005F7F667|nr:hypothetical protein [Pseudofrankia sp. DC12]